MKLLTGIVSIVALLLTASAQPPHMAVVAAAHASFHQTVGSRIAFTRLREDVFDRNSSFHFDAEIWIMNGDGSDPTRLTDNTTDDLGAEWSPDGRTIAFHGAQWNADRLTLASPAQIFLLDVESGTEMPLVTGRFPSWSPNGRKIAFDTRDQKIFVINADGSDEVQLHPDPDPNVPKDPKYRGSVFPDWSPDGRRIAFIRNRIRDDDRPGTIPEIWLMNADGSDPALLMNNAAGPDWSPDGRRIVFSSESENIGNKDVYVMNADGTDPRRLTDYPGPDSDPDWSPDGRMIVFQRTFLQDTPPRQVDQLFVVSADGGEPTGEVSVALTDLPSGNAHPAWSRGRAVKACPDRSAVPAFCNGRN